MSLQPPFVWREWRWVALLPDRVIFTAKDADAWRRLELEAEVITRWRAALGSCVPSVTMRDALKRTQIRERVEGLVGRDVEHLVFGTRRELTDADRYQETCPLSTAGSRLAGDLGRTLAKLHRALTVHEAIAMGLGRSAPRLGDAIEDTLRRHVKSPLLEQALASARSWLSTRTSDDVVVHGDPHLHNLAVDPTTGALRGLFDFDEIAIADRARDLSYLHSSGLPFARAALRAYAEIGPPVDEDAVGRYHVVLALDHFNFVAPSAERFPRIVNWATGAVTALAADWL